MANILEKIGEGIFNINFWWQYERPIRKSMRKVRNYMDEAIEYLERASDKAAPKNDDSAVEDQEIYEDDGYCDSLKASMVEMSGRYADEVRRTHEIKETIKNIDKVTNELEAGADDSSNCDTMDQFQRSIQNGKEKIILTGAMYKLWKYFMRAATKRKTSQTINVSGEWNVTFGYADDMVILSTPRRGRNTIGVYRVDVDSTEKNIIFTRVD